MLCFIGTDTLPPKSVSVFSILLESVREGKERDTPRYVSEEYFFLDIYIIIIIRSRDRLAPDARPRACDSSLDSIWVHI